MAYIYPNGNATVTIPAGEKIAVYSFDKAKVYDVVSLPNYPKAVEFLFAVDGSQTASSAYTTGGTVIVEAGASGAYYEVGVDPIVKAPLQKQYQANPNALNATGTLTSAMVHGGIVTSTSAAAVTATLNTGAVMDAASEWAIGDSLDWSVINTGPNTFTVTAAASGHTVVGAGAVVTATSAMFRTRKTAADTFVTYRLS